MATVINGTSGSDTIIVSSTSNVNAGAGDDTVVVSSASLGSKLNGGTGLDTLDLSGNGLTLNIVSGANINGFEVFDITSFGTGSGNTANFSLAGIIQETQGVNDATGSLHSVVLKLGQNDSYNFMDTGWSQGAPVMLAYDHMAYHVYLNAQAKVYVEDRAPIARGDVYNINEDAPLTMYGSVLTNDSDADHDGITAQLISGPSHAINFVFNANGTFSYQPGANYNGDDSFSYRVVDSLGVTGPESIATATIHIAPVNDAPVINPVVPDFTIIEDEVSHISGLAFLVTDPDGDSFSFVPQDITSSLGAHVTLDSAGNLIYDASVSGIQHLAANVEYSDNINYTVVDSFGASSTGTLHFDVFGQNDAPVLTPISHDLADVPEGTISNAMQVGDQLLVNFDTDVDAGALRGVAITVADNSIGQWQYSLNNTDWVNITGVSATHALLLGDADYVRYIPGMDQNSGFASIEYQAWDQTSGVIAGFGDASVNGGTTAFSINQSDASVNIMGDMFPPVNSYGGSVDFNGFLIIFSGGANNAPMAGFGVADQDSTISYTTNISLVYTGSGGFVAQLFIDPNLFSSSDGVTITGNGTNNLTIDGNVAQINSELDTLHITAPGSGTTYNGTITTTENVTGLPMDQDMFNVFVGNSQHA